MATHVIVDAEVLYQLTAAGRRWLEPRREKLRAAHAHCGEGKCVDPDAFEPKEDTLIQFLIPITWGNPEPCPKSAKWMRKLFADNAAECRADLEKDPDRKGLYSTIEQHQRIADTIETMIADAMRDGLIERVHSNDGVLCLNKSE
jgi:hypothetical protein